MKRLLFLFALSAVLVPGVASAAQLRLVQQPGSKSVAVVLDTQGETINAIEGSIDLPGGAGAVLLGSSVVPLWVVRPSTQDMRFSGIVPGGYGGSDGELFRFVPSRAGQLTITPRDVHAYLNDGKGTEAAISAVPLNANIPGGLYVGSDTDIPEFSEVRVARDPSVFDDKWFVAFNAQDAGTGVTRYEIAERPGDSTDNTDQLEWHAATSPALLTDQTRRSTVFVRAIDGAGNMAIQHVAPSGSRIPNAYAIFGALALVALLLAGWFALRRTRKLKR